MICDFSISLFKSKITKASIYLRHLLFREDVKIVPGGPTKITIFLIIEVTQVKGLDKRDKGRELWSQILHTS